MSRADGKLPPPHVPQTDFDKTRRPGSVVEKPGIIRRIYRRVFSSPVPKKR